jgi:hypothetical protein
MESWDTHTHTHTHTHTQSIPIVQPTRCICYLKLYILVKRSTCFGLSVHHQEIKTAYTATVYVKQLLLTATIGKWGGKTHTHTHTGSQKVWLLADMAPIDFLLFGYDSNLYQWNILGTYQSIRLIHHTCVYAVGWNGLNAYTVMK